MPRDEDIYLGPRKQWVNRRGHRDWHRHLPWLLPLAACVLFLVLIIGSVAVRQLIVRRGSGQTESAQLESATETTASSPGQNKASTRVSSAVPPRRGDDPDLEVLPPRAAKQSGRTLPKMLLVGLGPEMFHTLEDAVSAAIPGDIIEIRTNQPMTVAGAELRVKQKSSGMALTIRAGPGFEPVLRGVPERALLTVVNADLKLVRLHLVSATLNTKHSNVDVRRCTLTSVNLSVLNSPARTETLQVSVDQCFMRKRSIKCEGPGIAVQITDSAAICGHPWVISLKLDEDQAVSVERCTFLNAYLLQVLRQNGWPSNPPSFRMNRSIFGLLHCCPVLVEVGVAEPDSELGLDGAIESLRRAFREFHAADNFARFWGFWANVGQAGAVGGFTIDKPVFPELPHYDETFKFSERMEEARALIFERNDMARAQVIIESAVPQDLVVNAAGELKQRMERGDRYGADVSNLPVPPRATLEQYDPASVLVAGDAQRLRVTRTSEQFAVEREGNLGKLHVWWLPEEQHLFGYASKAGQWVELAMPIPRAGKYRVRAHLTRGPEFGIVRILLNGRLAGADVDLGAAELVPLQVDLGEFDLQGREAVLRIETVGSSSQSPKPGFRFGIDCLILRRVSPP